jgi:hypothetical protein
MKSKLLIPANARSYFIILFTILTTIAWAFQIEVSRRISLTHTSFGDGLIWGLLMGTLQWLVLRKYISSKHWISATAIGWGIIIQFGDIGGLAINFNFGLFVLVSPLLLGLFQWLLLRHHVQYAWVWIIVPALSLAPITSLVNNVKLGTFDHKSHAGTIMSLVLAISFCLLQRKNRQAQNFEGP